MVEKRPESSQRNRVGRARLPHGEGRHDPADPRQVRAYVSKLPELSIDERIRAVVAGIEVQPPNQADIPEEEFLLLEEEAEDLVLTPGQLQEMTPEAVEQDDVTRFLESLSPAQRQEVEDFVKAPLADPPTSSLPNPGEAEGGTEPG